MGKTSGTNRAKAAGTPGATGSVKIPKEYAGAATSTWKKEVKQAKKIN